MNFQITIWGGLQAGDIRAKISKRFECATVMSSEGARLEFMGQSDDYRALAEAFLRAADAKDAAARKIDRQLDAEDGA